MYENWYYAINKLGVKHRVTLPTYFQGVMTLPTHDLRPCTYSVENDLKRRIQKLPVGDDRCLGMDPQSGAEGQSLGRWFGA